jgi:large subunit ribosomal protein L13
MATQIATVLMGKHRPEYTAHVDTGDFVIVTNAEKVKVTGRKAEMKEYDYYTNHSGGRKVVSYADMMAKKPEMIIIEAVRRMLPKTKLGRHMLTKLKVYRGTDHPHAAQQPQVMELN